MIKTCMVCGGVLCPGCQLPETQATGGEPASGRRLTQAEVMILPDGTAIDVSWPGNPGPFRYKSEKNPQDGFVYARCRGDITFFSGLRLDEAAIVWLAEPPGTCQGQEAIPKSDRTGPNGSPTCPKCGNSSQNGIPSDSPHLRRCATCKTVFEPVKPDTYWSDITKKADAENAAKATQAPLPDSLCPTCGNWARIEKIGPEPAAHHKDCPDVCGACGIYNQGKDWRYNRCPNCGEMRDDVAGFPAAAPPVSPDPNRGRVARDACPTWTAVRPDYAWSELPEEVREQWNAIYDAVAADIAKKART